MTVAEEQISIANRKDHSQSEATRESICQNLEPLLRTECEEQVGSTVSAGSALIEVDEEIPRNWRGSHGEVDVLRLEERGVGGSAPHVLDVC